MESLTKHQKESYENAKICYICKKKIENEYLKDEKYCKVIDHCHYECNIEALLVGYVIYNIVYQKTSCRFL